MRLSYSPQARADLREIRRYIREVLKNPIAADRTVEKIVRACSPLKDLPYMGAALSEKAGIETDLRYLIVGRHLVFYKVESRSVGIVRILDGRTRYLKRLRGDL